MLCVGGLADSYMIAGLFALIFHVAASFEPEVLDDFPQEILHILLGAGNLRGVADEFQVGDVEGGAVEMGGSVDGVAVAAAQALYQGGGAQDACDLYPVVTAAAGVERVAEGQADFFQQRVGFRDKVGKGVGQIVEVVCLAGLEALQARCLSPDVPR